MLNRKFVAPITGVLSAIVVSLLPQLSVDLQQSIMVLIGLFVALIVGGDVAYDINVVNKSGLIPTASATVPTPTATVNFPQSPTYNTSGSSFVSVDMPTLADELEKLKNAPTVIVQPLNVPINSNSNLKAFKTTEWAGGRAKDVPDTFDIVWQALKPDDPLALPPELRVKEDGLQVEVAQRRGRLLLGQRLPVIIPTQRYLLKARIDCDLKLKPDVSQLAGMIAVHGQLCSDGAVLKQLDAWSPQNIEDATGVFEALWVFEFTRKLPNIEYVVEVRIGTPDSVPFADQSHITIQGIEVLPVAADYGGTGVYRV